MSINHELRRYTNENELAIVRQQIRSLEEQLLKLKKREALYATKVHNERDRQTAEMT